MLLACIRVLLVCSRTVTCMLLVRIRVARMYSCVTRMYPRGVLVKIID